MLASLTVTFDREAAGLKLLEKLERDVNDGCRFIRNVANINKLIQDKTILQTEREFRMVIYSESGKATQIFKEDKSTGRKFVYNQRNHALVMSSKLFHITLGYRVYPPSN